MRLTDVALDTKLPIFHQYILNYPEHPSYIYSHFSPFETFKLLGKEKNTQENNFLMFCFNVENIKENQI